jgi:hypothetical protein
LEKETFLIRPRLDLPKARDKEWWKKLNERATTDLAGVFSPDWGGSLSVDAMAEKLETFPWFFWRSKWECGLKWRRRRRF